MKREGLHGTHEQRPPDHGSNSRASESHLQNLLSLESETLAARCSFNNNTVESGIYNAVPPSGGINGSISVRQDANLYPWHIFNAPGIQGLSAFPSTGYALNPAREGLAVPQDNTIVQSSFDAYSVHFPQQASAARYAFQGDGNIGISSTPANKGLYNSTSILPQSNGSSMLLNTLTPPSNASHMNLLEPAIFHDQHIIHRESALTLPTQLERVPHVPYIQRVNSNVAAPPFPDSSMGKVDGIDVPQKQIQSDEDDSKKKLAPSTSDQSKAETHNSSAGRKKTTSRRTRTRKANPLDRPKRPLSSYNIFFQDERAKMLGESSDCTEKTKPISVGFAEMARLISRKWKMISPTAKSFYEQKAAVEKERYEKEKEEFQRRQQDALERNREELLATVDDETKRRYFEGGS